MKSQIRQYLLGTKQEATTKHDISDDRKKPKISTNKPKGIHIKLGGNKSTNDTKPKITVASVFNQDSDSEPEEMPPEARMRMRNIGRYTFNIQIISSYSCIVLRDTPTSAGPNSFGKTKHGFCDAKKVFEKSLKEAMNNADRNDA